MPRFGCAIISQQSNIVNAILGIYRLKICGVLPHLTIHVKSLFTLFKFRSLSIYNIRRVPEEKCIHLREITDADIFNFFSKT